MALKVEFFRFISQGTGELNCTAISTSRCGKYGNYRLAAMDLGFGEYLARWHLQADGDPIATPSSRLLPVTYKSRPAILKVAHEAEECWGGLLLLWWDGQGAVRVLAHHDNALLLERAAGTRSLTEMARNGRDDEASRIICSVAAELHKPRAAPPPELRPLPVWFQELESAAVRSGGILREAWKVSRELLEQPRDVVVLHGDLHHGNVLDAGDRGWLAIDPKRLIGERGFDFANIFCNPDKEVALMPGRLARQATVVANAAGLEIGRLLKWVLAYAGLSAAWSLGTEAEDPELALAVASIAATELAG